MYRNTYNDHLINVRLPLALSLRAKEVAQRHGMNISTFTRQALQRNIDLYLLHENALLSLSLQRRPMGGNDATQINDELQGLVQNSRQQAHSKTET